jgi:4-hydroxy-2-oxoheptanedioate aldolase
MTNPSALATARFKQRLDAGELQLGLWLTMASETSAEIAAGAGFDWLLIDMEHSPNGLVEVTRLLRTLAGYPICPIVRPPWNDAVILKGLLDVGAAAFVIPMVQNADEAAAAVRAVRYPPRGVRGFGGTTRANSYTRNKSYLAGADDGICLIAQVESRRALDNVEAIAAVDGVDAIFVGYADLAADLGHLGAPGHEDVLGASVDAIHRIRRCSRPAGFLTADPEHQRLVVEAGARFVGVGSDAGLLVAATDRSFSEARARYGSLAQSRT